MEDNIIGRSQNSLIQSKMSKTCLLKIVGIVLYVVEPKPNLSEAEIQIRNSACNQHITNTKSNICLHLPYFQMDAMLFAYLKLLSLKMRVG